MCGSRSPTAKISTLTSSKRRPKQGRGLSTSRPLGSGNTEAADMPKTPKRPRDFSQAAKLVVDIASGQIVNRELTPEEQGKDPAAVALGKRGGLKGGLARAAKMTKEQRSESARKAAKSRWERGN